MIRLSSSRVDDGRGNVSSLLIVLVFRLHGISFGGRRRQRAQQASSAAQARSVRNCAHEQRNLEGGWALRVQTCTVTHV